MFPMIERRRERRIQIALRVHIAGADAEHEAFSESVLAINLSRHGAVLWGVAAELRSGASITLHYGKHAAEFRVVWVLEEDTTHGTQVGLRLLHNQDCPWEEALPAQQAAEQLC